MVDSTSTDLDLRQAADEVHRFVDEHTDSIKEPVFFLCVAYDVDEDGVLPTPLIGIGLDSERHVSKFAQGIRERVRAAGADDRLSGFYNPANYELFETKAFHFRPSAELKTSFSSRVTDEGKCVLFYVELARALSEMKWRFAKTEDFCVFSTDIHLAHWTESFRACVAPALRARLAAGQWVPQSLRDT